MKNGEDADSLIPTMRSWTETVFRKAIADRSEFERIQIIDRFYKAYRDEVAEDTIGHSRDYVHSILDIEKTAN